jgi:hypothetical protein
VLEVDAGKRQGRLVFSSFLCSLLIKAVLILRHLIRDSFFCLIFYSVCDVPLSLNIEHNPRKVLLMDLPVDMLKNWF